MAATLLSFDPARIAREAAHARAAEQARRAWRRTWLTVVAQSLALALAGYVLYGLSWRLTGTRAPLLATGALVVGYALPYFRLLAFLLRHGDQF